MDHNTYAQQKNNSYFDGKVLDFLCYSLLAWAISFFTIGICTPWAICILLKWKTSHTVIDGRRLYFNGNAADLFFQWIKWFFLTLITFGIYSFWVYIKMEQWVTMHTHYIDEMDDY